MTHNYWAVSNLYSIDFAVLKVLIINYASFFVLRERRDKRRDAEETGGTG
jgi:hypothetical protein